MFNGKSLEMFRPASEDLIIVNIILIKWIFEYVSLYTCLTDSGYTKGRDTKYIDNIYTSTINA